MAALCHIQIWLPGQPDDWQSHVPGLSRRAECLRRNAQGLVCHSSFLLPFTPWRNAHPCKTAPLRVLWSVGVGTLRKEGGGGSPAPGREEGRPADFTKLFQPRGIYRSLGEVGFLWLFVGLPGSGDCGPIKGAHLLAHPPSVPCESSFQTQACSGPREVTPTWVPEACGEYGWLCFS